MRPRIIQFVGDKSLEAHLKRHDIPMSAVKTINHPVFKYTAPAHKNFIAAQGT